MYTPKGKGTFWFWTPGKCLQLCWQFSSVKRKLKICISEWYSKEKSFKICKQDAAVVTQLQQEIGNGNGSSLLLMQKEVAGLHDLEKNLCLK